MAKKTISVDVEASTYDFAGKVTELVANIKKHLADGVQLSDVAELVAEEFQAMVKAVSDIKDIPGEAADDMAAFIRTWGLAAGDLGAVFLVKK